MTEAVHISAAPPATVSQDYAALRERGMEWIRLWARDSWTDHNAHDPGITMLEAASYALTELGLRAHIDVADLLRSGEVHGAPELEPAHRVLPTGPVNAEDLRSLLLDHPLVSDAQIFLPAESEVPFFEVPDADPPLTYLPGTARVRPGGLYEVLVELADSETEGDRNSNTYALQVISNSQAFDIEIALPYWDDTEAAPFREGAVVNTVTMIVDAGEVWRAQPELLTYYGRVNVAFTDALGNPGSIEMWALMRITTPLPQPALVVPGILTAARVALESAAAGAPVPRFAARVRSAVVAVAELQDYVSGWRNLGEQAVRIGLARVQEIAIFAHLEVSGGIDIEQLFARIFMDIDAVLSPKVRFESLAERRADQPDPERIYEGPLLRRGFLDPESAHAARVDVLYTSDILRIIMQRRSAGSDDIVTQENPAGRDIVAVTDLTLGNFINNRPITTAAEDCLHLVQIERYRPRLSLAKSRLVAVRNDSEVGYDSARVRTLFDALQDELSASAVTDDPSAVWPVERGDSLPVEDFTPLQNELPATYGVGEARLPDSAGPQRHAAVLQLQGYLLMFEQYLGDFTSQVGNINRFYSGAAEEIPTYFTRPPFDLPSTDRLLRRFPAGGNWAAFIADPDNPVAVALHDAAENRERLLDRRNRMLDHLLARQGEDGAALGQEIHRWARAELAAASLPPSQQEAGIAARREAANSRLLAIKSAFLRDLPELNAFRLLANGNLFARDASLLTLEPVGDQFRWHLSIGGVERLRGTDLAASAAEAGIDAERAFALGGRATNYQLLDIGGGQRRVQLRSGSGTSAILLAENPQVFVSVGAANAAVTANVAAFVSLRIESSLSPMERRVAHYTGIRDPRRRRSLAPTSDFFEIFDEPVGPGVFGRRWRLHELPGNAGALLLASPVRYDAPSAAQADALAEQSIRRALRYGLDEWNYRVVAVGPNFTIELRDPADNLLAVGAASFATAALASAAITTVIAQLYRIYGGENLHVLEHLLLRPRRNGDAFLSLPVSETQRERDPYSQRISIVLPSGRARDFSLPAPAATTEVAPDRFRDLEFRRHLEAMVQRACPAHLLPDIYWVDRQAPGTPASTASFDTFENRYFAWLETLLVPGASTVAVDTARNDLVQTLNAIANDPA